MAIFAPFPLALGVVLYGRLKGIGIGVLGLVVSFLFSYSVYGDFTLFGFYLCVFLFALGISEIAQREWSPVKGLVGFGLGFILLVSGLMANFFMSQNMTPKSFILSQIEKSADKLKEQKKLVEQSTDKDAIHVLELLDRPDLMADQVMEVFPSYFFMGVFLMLWFNMFLTLKSRRLLLSAQDFKFSELNLLTFKVPFGFVPVLALGLILAVWGAEYLGKDAEVVGFHLIRSLGLFYFFQGFGVLISLLDFVGLFGFFRTVLVIMIVLMGNPIIAAAGLFDNWFDFRSYFIKNKTEE